MEALWVMRNGFSLPELAVTVAIIGILAGLGLPRTHQLMEHLAVDTAARQVQAAHLRARMAAIVAGRVTLLELGDTLRIRSVSGTDTSLVWEAPGPGSDGVALSGPARTLMFSPIGVGMGASNGTWHLSFGSATRDVTISRLGRLRIR